MDFGLADARIVPIVGVPELDTAEHIAAALQAGGLRVVEFACRTAAAEECIRRVAKAFPDVAVGAGTLLTPEHVDRARDAGAAFGMAPGLNIDVVTAAAQCGLPFVPGAVTPTEVERAIGHGCKLLKFFPAEASGGVAMLKALAEPYRHTGVKFIATGGITADNLQSYLAVPVVAAVGGSWIVDLTLVTEKRWGEITRLARAAIAAAA